MIVNGIDTAALAAFGEQLETTPEAAAMAVRVRTRWEQTYPTVADAEEVVVAGERVPRRASLTVDLPELFGGRDEGPAPAELLLAALGTCVSQGVAEGAALRGLAIERLEMTIEGQLDLRGTAGLDNVRPGLDGVRLAVRVAADATSPVLDEILEKALATSPVADSLRRGVSVDTELQVAAHASITDRHGEG